MTMGVVRRLRKLDPKTCFEVWAKTGSIYKAPLVLKNEYGLVKENGMLFSPTGIWHSATLYIIESPFDARKIFEDVWRANGVIIKDADWYKFLLEKAHYLSPTKFAEFMEKHSYLRPYDENKS